MFNFKNFCSLTIADWTRCELPDISPDFVSFSGSAYWDLGNRVRRWSDHWGPTKSCKWFLEGKIYNGLLTCGECYYDDFHNIVGREPIPMYKNIVSKEIGDNQIEISGPCVISGQPYQITVPKKAFLNWKAGDIFIQEIPGLTNDDLEFLMSGVSPEGWAQLESVQV